MTALVAAVEECGDLSLLEDLAGEAFRFAQATKSARTLQLYRRGWAEFTTWCEGRRLAALPAHPQTVSLYMTDLARRAKVATIALRLSAISEAHKAAGHPSPTTTPLVHTTMSGIRRTLGVAQTCKAPVLITDLRAMVDVLDPDRMVGIRDRALLVLGFAGAFRRSELVALNVEDVTESSDGLTVVIRRSKTDQEGRGRKIGIPYGSNPATCPVRCYRAWLEASGIVEGPVFRPVRKGGGVSPARLGAQSVAIVIKRTLQRAGIDPATYSGHSLRAGLVTSAAQAGATERLIMRQTGHKSLAMVRRYIRDGDLFRENAAAVVGL